MSLLTNLLETIKSDSIVYPDVCLFSLANSKSQEDFLFATPSLNMRTKTLSAIVTVDPRKHETNGDLPYFAVANLVLMEDVPELRSDDNLSVLVQTIDDRLKRARGGMYRIHNLVHSSNGVHVSSFKYKTFSRISFVMRKYEFLQFYNTADKTQLPENSNWVCELSYRGIVYQVCSKVIGDLLLTAPLRKEEIMLMIAPFLPNLY